MKITNLACPYYNYNKNDTINSEIEFELQKMWKEYWKYWKAIKILRVPLIWWIWINHINS